MTVETRALALARAYHRAWTSERFADAGKCLSDELQVEVPINSYATKAAFLDGVRRTRAMTSKVDILADFGNDDEALILYDMTLPFGQIRIAEYFAVKDGRIGLIRHIHDTAAIRAALNAAT
jgi:hypothetical protein